MSDAKLARFAVAAPVRTEGDMVFRPGKLFEVDKVFTDMNGVKFGVTRQEAEAAIAGKAIPVGLQHTPTVLDGLFGTVAEMWIDGNDIMGMFALPKWIDEGTGGKELYTSSEWDVTNKRIVKADLVFEPAVKDAVIKAAFAAHPEAERDRQAQFVAAEAAFPGIIAAFERHDTPEGQRALQEIHDAAARYGAVCRKDNAAKFASRHEASGLQAVHDLTAEHGAQCRAGKDPYRSMAGFSAIDNDQPAPPAKGATMSFIAKFNAWRAGQKAAGVPDANLPPEFTDADLPAPAAGASPELLAKFTAQESRLAAQDAEITRLKRDSQLHEAREYVDVLHAAGKIATHEKAGIIARFSQAIEDDLKVPTTVKFSAPQADGKIGDTTGSRFDAAKAEYAMRPSSGLTAELVGTWRAVVPNDYKALFAAHEETEDEKKKRLEAEADEERKKLGLAPKKKD